MTPLFDVLFPLIILILMVCSKFICPCSNWNLWYSTMVTNPSCTPPKLIRPRPGLAFCGPCSQSCPRSEVSTGPLSPVTPWPPLTSQLILHWQSCINLVQACFSLQHQLENLIHHHHQQTSLRGQLCSSNLYLSALLCMNDSIFLCILYCLRPLDSRSQLGLTRTLLRQPNFFSAASETHALPPHSGHSRSTQVLTATSTSWRAQTAPSRALKNP